ncbi:MAG: hypothetical protein LAN37_10970 [Acidobacteriia bacterium]|nr:hypothetical protein [Terriglobia bacterium]
MNAFTNANMELMAPPEVTRRIGRRSLIAGVIGAVALLAGAFLDPAQFFRSYLLGYMLWIGVTLGCLALLMLQHLSGGQWGFVIRRPCEAATRNLLLMLVLFVPLFFGLGHLYHWSHAAELASDPVLRHKVMWLRPPWFITRVFIYFFIWIVLASLLNRWSLAQDSASVDSDESRSLRSRLQALSGPGLVIWALTVTFMSVDWVMSLDPHWASTIYGMLFMAGEGLSALALMIVLLVILGKYPPFSRIIAPVHFHDLGKLLLAFVMLWAYFSYSQFLIIWAGNLPDEIPWYLGRTHGAYRAVALAIIVFHFALPFALLLSRDLKRNARKLAMIASLLIVMRYLDLFWLIAPNPLPGTQNGIGFSWMDIAAPLGIGGIWLAAFFWQLQARPLVAVRDPLFETMMAKGHRHE